MSGNDFASKFAQHDWLWDERLVLMDELCAARCGAFAIGWLDDVPVCFDCAELMIEDNLSSALIATDPIARDEFHLRLELAG